MSSQLGRYSALTSSEVGVLGFFHRYLANPVLGMPDFVYSTTASSFTNRFRDQILPFDCEYLQHVNSRKIYLTSHSRENETVRAGHEQRRHSQRRHHPTPILQPRRRPIPLHVS